MNLPEEVLSYFQRLRTNVRELDGALKSCTLKQLQDFKGGDIDVLPVA